MLRTAAILLAMGRPPICACGDDRAVGAVGPEQSQMLADWYSPSHIVHGFLFYAAAALGRAPLAGRTALPRRAGRRGGWEIIENTPAVIDRYREATIALGYIGRQHPQSVSDIAMMAVGFLAARKLPYGRRCWSSCALELVPLLVIRDNLMLNVWMLLAPNRRGARVAGGRLRH